MELREFIKQTIIQITDGLREGDKYIQENNFGSGVSDTQYEEISFDVAIASNEEETTGATGKLSVVSVFSAGLIDESKSTSSTVSRIKFKTLLHVKTKR